MNLGNTEISNHKIIVIEWLDDGDRKTGKDLYDDVLLYKTSSTIPLTSEYHLAKSKDDFIAILQEISNNHQDGEIVTLDIETHGSVDGLGLSQGEILSWTAFFDLTRPLNVKCGGLLVITLSMCLGLANIIGVTPEKRAPFSVIIGANRVMFPDELYDCMSGFYREYDSLLSLSISLNALNKSFIDNGTVSPFLPISSITWFDEFFKESRILEAAEINASKLASQEGIDVECAKWQIVEDMRELRSRNRDYFNFFDVHGISNAPLQFISERGSENDAL